MNIPNHRFSWYHVFCSGVEPCRAVKSDITAAGKVDALLSRLFTEPYREWDIPSKYLNC